MGETHVLSALRQMRGHVAGKIVAAERNITELRASLVHLDATLKLFAGEDANPEAIPPRLPRPTPALSGPLVIGRGDLVRAVLDVLRRNEGGMTSMQIKA